MQSLNARACGAPTQHLTNLEEKPVLETAGQRQAKVQRELDVREDPPLLRSGHGQHKVGGKCVYRSLEEHTTESLEGGLGGDDCIRHFFRFCI